MEEIFFNNTSEIRKNLAELKQKLKVDIGLSGKKVTIDGDAINEFTASQVLNAINTGFSAKRALLLLDEEMAFVKIPIKSFTRRKDMDIVRGRIIGREGKTKRTIEDVAGCFIVVNEDQNEVGIIGSAESIEETKTAITNLIHGTKEANVYRFLERMNTERKKSLYDFQQKKKEESKK